MGGTTIRMLEYLLQKGDANEVSTSGAAVSNLFQTNRGSAGGNWIRSIFTLSTPFDGSPLQTVLHDGGTFSYNGVTIFSLTTFLQQAIAVAAEMIDLVGFAWVSLRYDTTGKNNILTNTDISYMTSNSTNSV